MFQLVFIIFFLFLSCQRETTSKDNTIIKIEKEPPKNLMTISVKPEEIKGKIEIYEGNPEVYFVLNWETKSRITYRILNPDEFNLRKMNGRILKLEGKIKKSSSWSGEIEVLKVISD